MFKLNELTLTVLVAISCFLVGDLYGVTKAKKHYEIEKIKIDNAATEKYNKLVADTNQTVGESKLKISELQAKAERVEQNAKTTIDNMRSDVRNRVVRLSVPVASCTANPVAGDFTFTTNNGQARAELLPETVLDLIGIASDANSEVRRTNLCIDQYNEMKSMVDRLREAQMKKPQGE